ncbi:MAG: hypothetical protein E7A81_06835 [Clostridiales bacterium]|nr:hypothetical protein [Clostridiales bacterium]MDU1042716.1 hypothetical protein [Clostridiales bacterium]MDU3490447.1 hypothetical protein [Clostridiales bacterium]
MKVEFQDFSLKCQTELNDITTAWLYEAAAELTAATKRRSRVDTGQTKGSWTFEVKESTGEAKVGSPLQNAVYEEFGTGQYALSGNGRKTSWVYKDKKGKFHRTLGKKPRRSLHNAFLYNKAKIRKALEVKLKGLNNK